MKKVLGSILFVIYAIIAITVTVLLLSYNEYNNSQLGGYTVYIVNDDSLEPQYKQGSILLIKSTNDKNVMSGDEILLYKVINSQQYEVVTRTLENKTQQGSHIIYSVENEESYANDYFIGKVSDTVVIEGWGYILSLLESKWGYLFCVVIVSLLLFLQEVFDLVVEIKYVKDKNKKGDAVEAEHSSEIVEEEPATKPRTAGTTKKTTTAKPKATGTAKKTTSTTKPKTTGTAKKATSTSATKTKTAGTTKKTTTRKTSATKPVKEEE